MDQPEFTGPADEGDDEQLYNPITYEQDTYEASEYKASGYEVNDDVWLPGRAHGGATPAAGGGRSHGWTPPPWAPSPYSGPVSADYSGPVSAGPWPVSAEPWPPAPPAQCEAAQAEPPLTQPRFTPHAHQAPPLLPPPGASAFPPPAPAFPLAAPAFPLADPAFGESESVAPDAPYTPRGGGIWPDESWPPRLPPKRWRLVRPRWLIPGAAVLALVAAAAVTIFALAG